MKPSKACPIVVRDIGGELSVLAFLHPLAGIQLVKRTIEEPETASSAAVRELAEESGVTAATISDLGIWHSGYDDQIWSFHLCRASEPLPETWTHQCPDDGGHTFKFFWQVLTQDPSSDWHPTHAAALGHVKEALRALDRLP